MSYTALLLNFYIGIVALFLLTNSNVYHCVVVNWSTFTIINHPCIYFYKIRQLRVHLFGRLHLNGLAEKGYLSSRINDPLFCLWHTTTATKAVCKSCRFPILFHFLFHPLLYINSYVQLHYLFL